MTALQSAKHVTLLTFNAVCRQKVSAGCPTPPRWLRPLLCCRSASCKSEVIVLKVTWRQRHRRRNRLQKGCRRIKPAWTQPGTVRPIIHLVNVFALHVGLVWGWALGDDSSKSAKEQLFPTIKIVVADVDWLLGDITNSTARHLCRLVCWLPAGCHAAASLVP